MSQLLQHPTLLKQINTQYPVYGILKGFDEQNYPQILIEHNALTSLLLAETICELSHDDIGNKVLVNFVEGNFKQVVIVGIIKIPTPVIKSTNVSLFNDIAIQDIEINSGLSSITLKPTGRIEIKGVELDFKAVGNVSINGEKVLLNCDKEHK